MSSTRNNNFTTVCDDQLDAWDAGFKAELEYFNQNGIERPREAQGINVSNSGQLDFSTFGDHAHKNSPDHDALALVMDRFGNEAEVPSPYTSYQNTQGPESRVDNDTFGHHHQHPSDQENLAPYAGQIVDIGSGAQDAWQISTYQLVQSPQHHVDDQGFDYQGQYHAIEPNPAPTAEHLMDENEAQFLGNNYKIPDPTEPNAAGPSSPTSYHALGAQQVSSIQHVGIVASQDNGDGVAQMTTQGAQPLTSDQRGRRNPKGRTTKRVDDTRRRRVRPGPAGGLTLELFNPVTEGWDPAIRHADIRAQLLHESDVEATQNGGYDFAPAEGEDEADRTSFVRAHHTWGPERANRPDINFIFDRPRNALPAHVQPCSQPVPWLWQGYMVIDHADDPMRHFDDCPTVLSSAVEGFRVDAIQKRNPAITTLDLWGRLPPQHTKRGIAGGVARTKELNTTQAVTNVAWRWRHKACIVSWERRAGWEHTRAFLKEFLTPQQLAQNTTRGREDLTKEEVKELEEYVQSAKAAQRAKRRVPPPPRRNNVDTAGPTTLLPNADASPSLTTAEHMQQGHGNPSNQNLAPQFPEPHVPARHLQQAHVDPSLPQAQGPARLTNQGYGDPNSQNIDPRPHQAQAPSQWRGMQQPPRQQPPRQQAYADAMWCSSSPRSLKRKAETIEEGDWKEAAQEIDNIFHRPRDPSTPGSVDVSHVAKRPRHDSIPVGAASRAAHHSHSILVKSEANEVTPAPGEEAVHGNGIGTAAGHPILDLVDPVDAVRNQESEHHSYSPEEQYVVAPGYEPVVFPIGSTITVFSPDGVTVQQGFIAVTADTIWKQRGIAETIRALHNVEPATGVNGPTDDTSSDTSHEKPPQALDGTPPQVLDNNHSETFGIGEKRSASTKGWLFSVPQGTKAFQFPIGDTKVCFMESDMEVRQATLAADGETEWNEISKPEAISMLETMQVRRQTPISPTNAIPEQELEHDTLPSSVSVVIASENNLFGGSDAGMEASSSHDRLFGGTDVDIEAGANNGLQTALIATSASPDTMDPRLDGVWAELEQQHHGDGVPAENYARLEAVQRVANTTVHGDLAGQFRRVRSPNFQAETQSTSVANSAATAFHGDLNLPLIENWGSAADPFIAPSLRDLIDQGALRSRNALEQYAYTKELLSEDEILILNDNKILVPTWLPEQFQWCKDSKRWVSKPPSRVDARPIRDASPEKDDINWEDWINQEYLEENEDPD